MRQAPPCGFCGSPNHEDSGCAQRRELERRMAADLAEPEGIEPWRVEWFGEESGEGEG